MILPYAYVALITLFIDERSALRGRCLSNSTVRANDRHADMNSNWPLRRPLRECDA